MKKLISVLIIITSLISLTGCNLQLTNKEDGGGASEPGQETTVPAVAYPTERPDTTPEASTEPKLLPVPAIVFDETIEDPVTTLSPFEGEATLKLTLFETSPGVFEGQGVLNRLMDIQAMSSSSSDVQYRLAFPQIKAGEVGQLTVLSRSITEQSQTWGDNPELGSGDIHLFMSMKTPLTYELSMEGNSAQLYLKLLNFEFNFAGQRQELPPLQPPGLDSLAGRCIAINSTFCESGQNYNHEYRAMLTATASGSEYAGDLCVYGSGTGIPQVDEAVRFTLQPFDAQAYKEAGGRFLGSFAAFGLISDGKYIVLIEGDTAFLEPVGSGYVFWGSLPPEEQAEAARQKAEESKRLMRTLYDGCDKTKFSVGGGTMPGGWRGKPAWYPDWLMPEPIAPYNWFWYEMANELGYNRYRAQYEEEQHWLEEVLESYTRQVSGNTDFEVCTYITDYEAEATIYFTKGAYSVWMVLSETSAGTDVIFYII